METNHENWIDITTETSNETLVWPGDPKVSISKVMSIESGDKYNLTTITMSAHTATHIDAPLHFLSDGYSVTDIELNNLIGFAKVIEVKDKEVIQISDLKHKVKEGDRILLKTNNSSGNWASESFNENFVYLSSEAAEFLKVKQIQVVGIDYISISGKENSEQVHKTLLAAGIIIIEGLDLSNVEEGEYEMICLPLKIKNADGAPARVILRRIQKP